MLDRLKVLFEARVGFPFDPHVILLGYVGSIAHGTHTPSVDPASIDDVDLMGVVIPPPELALGAGAQWEDSVIKEDEIDAVFYSLQKFLRLLVKSNPNVLGTLWLDPAYYLVLRTYAYRLIDERARFSTLNAYNAFVGYAYGQLKRMEAFDVARMDEYEWLTEQIRGLGVPARTILEADSNKLAHLKREHDAKLSGHFLDRFRSLHKQYFSGYMGEKRKAIVRRVGYDSKNAAHLIRLMRMCCEFLSDGRLQVNRAALDADELRVIKSGRWTLDEVKQEAERLFALAKEIKATSPLPESPDVAAINVIASDLHLAFWGLGKLSVRGRVPSSGSPP